MDRLLESQELDRRANGRGDSGYDDNSVEGRRCFSRKGISLFNYYFYINGLIGLERPALDCGNHSRIIGLDWKSSTLSDWNGQHTAGTIREMIRLLDLRKAR
jgi:hypothetical protein